MLLLSSPTRHYNYIFFDLEVKSPGLKTSLKTFYIEQVITALLQVAGFSHLIHTSCMVVHKASLSIHVLGLALQKSSAKKVSSTREYLLLEKQYYIPLGFRLFFFFLRNCSFTLETIQYHQQKIIIHFLLLSMEVSCSEI